MSAEYFIYLDGKPVEIEGISSIETAYTALRKAEGLVQHPGADGSPFTYLKKNSMRYYLISGGEMIGGWLLSAYLDGESQKVAAAAK